MINRDLFEHEHVKHGTHEHYFSRVDVFRGLASVEAENIINVIKKTVLKTSPFRFMLTPGGRKMSASITNCGQVGWVSDQQGYRYSQSDPYTHTAWPSMPECLRDLAQRAALLAGFENFNPDSCIINKYAIGSKMSLHQDKDEQDFTQPIVSISLGIPAVFEVGGFKRTDKVKRIALFHGDVVVWGGEDRLRFHGILPIKENTHPVLKHTRLNITLRHAL
jgi:alkylated DNA repair protein (DNA oxidative demethylase)